VCVVYAYVFYSEDNPLRTYERNLIMFFYGLIRQIICIRLPDRFRICAELLKALSEARALCRLPFYINMRCSYLTQLH